MNEYSLSEFWWRRVEKELHTSPNTTHTAALIEKSTLPVCVAPILSQLGLALLFTPMLSKTLSHIFLLIAKWLFPDFL
jgi:hypothetical protein